MKHPELERLVAAHEEAEKGLRESSLVIWNALVKAEPELAADILGLFSTPEAAARFVTLPFRGLKGSPARHAAEGRAEEIMSVVRKSDHGFVG